MLLNARIAAVHLGYLTVPEFVAQTRRTLGTIQRLPQLPRAPAQLVRQHDAAASLEPRFVSTVDSGNLAAALWTLKQAALAFARQAPRGRHALGRHHRSWPLLLGGDADPAARALAERVLKTRPHWRQSLPELEALVLRYAAASAKATRRRWADELLARLRSRARVVRRPGCRRRLESVLARDRSRRPCARRGHGFRVSVRRRAARCCPSATTPRPADIERSAYDLLASEARIAASSPSRKETSRRRAGSTSGGARGRPRRARAAVVDRHAVRVPHAGALVPPPAAHDHARQHARRGARAAEICARPRHSVGLLRVGLRRARHDGIRLCAVRPAGARAQAARRSHDRGVAVFGLPCAARRLRGGAGQPARAARGSGAWGPMDSSRRSTIRTARRARVVVDGPSPGHEPAGGGGGAASAIRRSTPFMPSRRCAPPSACSTSACRERSSPTMPEAPRVCWPEGSRQRRSSPAIDHSGRSTDMELQVQNEYLTANWKRRVLLSTTQLAFPKSGFTAGRVGMKPS